MDTTDKTPVSAIKPVVLYISNNDGSDTRIVKEVRTLSRAYDLHFIGVGRETDSSFARAYCKTFILIPGDRRSIKCMLLLMFRIMQSRIKLSPSSIHVINEQLLAAIWPTLIGSRFVLDIFDSLFLRLNKPGNKLKLAKRMLYGFSHRIIVTDQYRADLLPDFAKSRAVVIPNVPFKSGGPNLEKKERDGLTLGYFGSLAENRGTSLVQNLLAAHPDIRVICAGWPADDSSTRLAKHPRVTNLGVINQKEVNEVIARDVDYIVSIYPTGNLNNYYASPNKMYDAIHTLTPLIISDNVKVSEFVAEHNLGIIVTAELLNDPVALGHVLKQKRGCYSIDKKLVDEFCWERFETTLISVHSDQ